MYEIAKDAPIDSKWSIITGLFPLESGNPSSEFSIDCSSNTWFRMHSFYIKVKPTEPFTKADSEEITRLTRESTVNSVVSFCKKKKSEVGVKMQTRNTFLFLFTLGYYWESTWQFVTKL
jgi:hypothetical protein